MADSPGRRPSTISQRLDIRREGRGWSREEIERKYLAADEDPHAPGRMELIYGKLYHSDAQRLTMLGWMLEMMGADAAVRLGDSEVWREAVRNLPSQTVEQDTKPR